MLTNAYNFLFDFRRRNHVPSNYVRKIAIGYPACQKYPARIFAKYTDYWIF